VRLDALQAGLVELTINGVPQLAHLVDGDRDSREQVANDRME
jgi:hypothetical protein